MLGNAYRNRPDIQARSLANRRNPEWMRHEEVIRNTRGLFLGHFKKKELARQWQGEWVKAGKPSQPHDLPEFPEWLEAKREELTLKRDTEREDRRLGAMIHKRWVDAGMPDPWVTRSEEAADAIEEFKRTAKPKMREIAESVAAYNAQFYKPKDLGEETRTL
jgi:hypothetical protein